MSSTTLNYSPETFSNKQIFPDLHLIDGPLQIYRTKSSFDWRKMRLIMDTLDTWELRMKLWTFMENSPDFARNHETPSLDEQRRIASKRVFVLANERFLDALTYFEKPQLGPKFSTAIGSYDPSIQVKLGIGFGMFPSVVMSLGTDRVQDIVYDNQKLENFGCFALTEFGHGSNTQGMKTTATYEKETKSFILNTPNFEASKCWVGNLGKTATHAVVYAQLYTPDGVCHGLNAFVCPVRDPKTMLAYPGVIIGDLGEKVSLNGVDNGFVMFHNYKIPKEFLLSKTGDVDDDGNFVTQYKDPKKRMGTSFAALSGGRVGICEIAVSYGVAAVTIAVRYSASRRQFGPEKSSEEFPIIEYQAQQYRVIPHLATVYAIKFFSSWIGNEYATMQKKMLTGDKVSAEAGMEMHAISSAGKPVCSWSVRDLIQDCREACGGHGYLKCARLGDLRNDNDPNCTYEGENNVLIQQASNFLLNLRAKGWESFESASPLGTVTYLKDGRKILTEHWIWTKVDCAMKPENLLTTFSWLVAYLLEKTFNRTKSLAQTSQFDVRNNSQIFNANSLAVAYAHRHIFAASLDAINKLESSPEKEVLRKLLSLYGSNLIVTKYLATLYEGKFIKSDINVGDLLQTGILGLLPVLKDEAVALVDAIAPTDFILNSPLGMSDGKIYKNLESFIYQTEDTFTRPKWWREIADKSYLKAKL